MAWAEVGKKAVFFHNGGASETCIGSYWYQCYREGEWWGMSHAEPFLMRTFYGDAEKLASAAKAVVQGKEVVVPCLADGPREQLQLGKTKLQRLKASLKRMEYDAKRDFVGYGAGEDGVTFDTIVLLPASTSGWKYLSAKAAAPLGERWRDTGFNDQAWRGGKSPLGYGEEEIAKRSGTTIAEPGQPFLFRRAFDVSADLLAKKDVAFSISVASDDGATIYLNGQLIDEDTEDHEFQYWNRDVTLQAKQLKPGRNVLAILVKNQPQSSDLFLDLEVTAQVPVTKTTAKSPSKADELSTAKSSAKSQARKEPPIPPSRIAVDKAKRTVTVTCAIASRKLPHLQEIYPIEVIATDHAGQKAHETVVILAGLKPSDLHKALEQLGLKPGKPVRGEGTPTGPEVRISLEVQLSTGKALRVPLEQALVERKTGKPLGASPKWYFTGSVIRQPDPEKPEKVYGADVTGTFVTLFPVTDDTVFQSNLTAKDEAVLKLETNKTLLPKEGSAARLIIEVAR
jgi:hypothetical protein